jgi:hypothetical protein
VPPFRKNDKTLSELGNEQNPLSRPSEAAEAFATYFKSVFNTHHIGNFSTNFQSTDSLSTAYIPNSDVFKAIRPSCPSTSVGPDDIPAFIIKGCSDIFCF